jgi:phosphatidylserine/phosphatidylglycerophosphate/cardiolipin synthase-like enzyme
MRGGGRVLGATVVVLLLLVGALLAFRVLGGANAPGGRPGGQNPESGAARGRADEVAGNPVVNIGDGGSIDGGWYQLYFTAPKYPDNPANHRGGPDERLVALMDQAQDSLDVACYDFDLANVADAMARARERGVAVRMVTDSETLANTRDKKIQDAFATLRAARIPIVEDQREPIMHNKFTVVDGEVVATGSWNYTDGDTYRLNNHLLIIRSPELAANYSAEFAKMFEKKQFGPTKARGVPNPVVTIAGTRIENYFAPEDKVADQIVRAIRGSTRSIAFLAFSFTHDGIARAMLDRRAAGVALSGVFETTGSNTEYSEFTKLKRQGVEVYQDGNPWVMHHKVIVIDERIVICGSFNFSDNADTRNDENLLIIDNPDIARAFKGEYDRVLALAKNPPPKRR